MGQWTFWPLLSRLALSSTTFTLHVTLTLALRCFCNTKANLKMITCNSLLSRCYNKSPQTLLYLNNGTLNLRPHHQDTISVIKKDISVWPCLLIVLFYCYYLTYTFCSYVYYSYCHLPQFILQTSLRKQFILILFVM